MTDRAKIANVKSLAELQREKTQRRSAKTGRSLVPVGKRAPGSRHLLRAANDSASLAEKLQAELARMDEPMLFNEEQLDLLGIIHPRSKNRAIIDAMRQLRTKLYQLKPDRNFSVLVTPAVPEAGGTFVSMNLAATIAFDQARTSMLVETNMDSPVLHRLLKVLGREDAKGLLEYLESPYVEVEQIVNPSGVPRMRVIPVGAHSGLSAEHFSSARYRQLMMEITHRYDNRYIVVDGPALSNSADAAILSDLCDYTVIVVPYGGVTPSTLNSMIDEIDERKLAGIVINNQPV
ncbi:MAG: CpsD/CapB family tyrosine-protein kinase [Granulosicoccus sp.]